MFTYNHMMWLNKTLCGSIYGQYFRINKTDVMSIVKISSHSSIYFIAIIFIEPYVVLCYHTNHIIWLYLTILFTVQYAVLFNHTMWSNRTTNFAMLFIYTHAVLFNHNMWLKRTTDFTTLSI